MSEIPKNKPLKLKKRPTRKGSLVTGEIPLPAVGIRAPKAYANKEFLYSRDGRILRVLAEYQQPAAQFRKHSVNNTIIFFGSARIMSEAGYRQRIDDLRESMATATTSERAGIRNEIDSVRKQKKMATYYHDAEKLAGLLTRWSLSLPPSRRMHVISGGGPGIMEAANKGAIEAGGLSIGLNISLPYEQYPNPFISTSMNFEFHYFFMRKFWFAYLAKALVIFPGGFGTLDELAEILTLVQTGKIRKEMPIILYGGDFWNRVVNFQYLAETGLIDHDDINLMKIANTPSEAFRILKKRLSEIHDL